MLRFEIKRNKIFVEAGELTITGQSKTLVMGSRKS